MLNYIFITTLLVFTLPILNINSSYAKNHDINSSISFIQATSLYSQKSNNGTIENIYIYGPEYMLLDVYCSNNLENTCNGLMKSAYTQAVPSNGNILLITNELQNNSDNNNIVFLYH